MDDVAFRRNNGGFSNNFNHSSHKHPNPVETETRESAVSSMDLKEKEFMSHQTESNHDDERKSQKTQNNDRIPVTLFGERLRKRIMNDEMEEKQKAHTLPKLEAELEGNTKEISEECITERESDKENGSHTSINNNASESKTVAQNSNSGNTNKENFIFYAYLNICVEFSGKHLHFLYINNSKLRYYIFLKRTFVSSNIYC